MNSSIRMENVSLITNSANKSLSSQSYDFSSSHVWMWELDYKESIEELILLKCGVGEDSLRFPWTARKSIQSILKETSPEYSLERLMLRLKLQYFGLLMWRTNSFEKTLMLERLKVTGEGNDRGWDGWVAHRCDGLEFEQALAVGDGQGGLACCRPWGLKESDTNWATELSWTEPLEGAWPTEHQA